MKSIGILTAALIAFLIQLLGLQGSQENRFNLLKGRERAPSFSISKEKMELNKTDKTDSDSIRTTDQKIDLQLYNTENGMITIP